jgi:hypothetical protein
MPSGVYKRTETTKRKMSESRKGYKFSNDSIRKMSESKKGIKNPMFKKYFSMETREKMSISKKNMSLETRKKIGDAHRGYKSYNWIKDRTKLKIGRSKDYDTQYKYWMLAVKKRDGWKCKINNSDCKGRLEAHHILNWVEYPELRYELNNGITLCHAHHPQKRYDEAKLSPYFQSLVAEMN